MSSEDIRDAEFGEVAHGGFDPAEVRAFLKDVADRVDGLNARIADADEVRSAPGLP